MKTLIVLVAVLLGAQGVSFLDLVMEQWKTFKVTYRKQYSSDTEEGFRMKIFMDNLHKIEIHNQRYELGLVSYNLAMNEFGDMLNHEFVAIYNGLNRTRRLQSLNDVWEEDDDRVTFIEPDNVKLPAFVDWSKKGAVTPVKNQGQCGSCWAFSATGSLEGQHFRKTGKLVSLSEQNLVDCSTNYGNHGCGGGWMDYAFKYIKYNHGIDTENSYPYMARDASCHYNPKNSGATDQGFVDIASGNEQQLQKAVATVGPISVAIDAAHSSFQLYHSGVYDEPYCAKAINQLDHGVLAVGYGTTADGKDYWIVKNSWGLSWGNAGYILMSRNKNNQCGIATAASYPLV